MVALRIDRAMEEAAKDQSGETAASYQEWFRGLQPEAIGPLLHNLVSEPVECDGEDGKRRSPEQMLVIQQTSILQCLEWMNAAEDALPESYRGATPNRIQRQFEESVTRMNTHGKKPEGDLTLVARNNVARLDEFMGKILFLVKMKSATQNTKESVANLMFTFGKEFRWWAQLIYAESVFSGFISHSVRHFGGIEPGPR